MAGQEARAKRGAEWSAQPEPIYVFRAWAPILHAGDWAVTMNHEEAFDLLTSYLDDEVTVEQRREIEAHLATCRICPKELEVLRRAQEALRRSLRSSVAGVDPPPQAWQQLQPSLEAGRPSLLFLFGRRRWRIVATVVLIALIVGLLVLWATGVLPGAR